VGWSELLLFLHVSAAVVWLGGGLVAQVLGTRVASAGDPAVAAALGRDLGWIGSRVFASASLLTFATGVLLVVDSDFYRFRDGWIALSLLLYAVTFLIGILVFGRETDRIAELAAQGSPEARPRRLRVSFIARLDVVLLFFVLFLMTVKPEVDSEDMLVGILGALLAGGIIWWRYRSALTEMETAPASPPPPPAAGA
jgi:uncharacterized membrane protein